MSDQIITSDCFFELSDCHQEFLIGGASPQMSENNFAQRFANTSGNNTSGPNGNVTNTNTQLVDINSSSRSLLSTDTNGVPGIGSFNNLQPNISTPANNSWGMF